MVPEAVLSGAVAPDWVSQVKSVLEDPVGHVFFVEKRNPVTLVWTRATRAPNWSQLAGPGST